MNDSTVTMTGNVVTKPKNLEFDDGFQITEFRLASTPRRYDRASGEYVDGETSYLTVKCYRNLARNAAASLSLGDPVVVTGRLKVEQWRREERSGYTTLIEATTLGHDLRRGITGFERVNRPRVVRPEDNPAIQEAMDQLSRMEEEFVGVDPVTGEILDTPEVPEEEAARAENVG
jgi:single-strand DNA-binding protein